MHYLGIILLHDICKKGGNTFHYHALNKLTQKFHVWCACVPMAVNFTCVDNFVHGQTDAYVEHLSEIPVVIVAAVM